MPSLAEAQDDDESVVSLKRDAEESNSLFKTSDWCIDFVSPPLKRQKSNPKTFPCTYENCGKSFPRPSKLQDHINTHTGKVFSIKSNVNNKRPYVCEECGKNFMKSTHLAGHKLIHSGNKKYKCSFTDCTYSTTTRQHLRNHELKHTNPTPYQVPSSPNPRLPPCETDTHVCSAPNSLPVQNLSKRNMCWKIMCPRYILVLWNIFVLMPTRDVKLHFQFLQDSLYT